MKTTIKFINDYLHEKCNGKSIEQINMEGCVNMLETFLDDRFTISKLDIKEKIDTPYKEQLANLQQSIERLNNSKRLLQIDVHYVHMNPTKSKPLHGMVSASLLKSGLVEMFENMILRIKGFHESNEEEIE